MEIVGYTNDLSTLAGARMSFKVSCRSATFEANLVRLHHGDVQPRAAGLIEHVVPVDGAGAHRGRLQTIHPGSAIVVPHSRSLNCADAFTFSASIMCTAAQLSEPQIIASKGTPGAGGFRFGIDAGGRLAIWANDELVPDVVGDRPLRDRHWYFVNGSLHRSGLRQIVQAPFDWSLARDYHVARGDVCRVSSLLSNSEPLLFGAALAGSEPTRFGLHFNGRIAAPRLYSSALSADEVTARSATPTSTPDAPDVVGAWDFSQHADRRVVVDVSAAGNHGRTHNMPTRAVTGPSWEHREVDPRHAPEQWNAIHFHDDDLDDAGWEDSFAFDLPDDLASGVYAARLIANGSSDYVPFVVRPELGTPTADLLLVLPTFSYLAYANERAYASPGYQAQMRAWGVEQPIDDDYDRYVGENRLKSMYGVHSDGSGVCYSSARRPLLNMRPAHLMRVLNRGKGSPHQFNADLHIVNWLRDKGIAFDVATDADLHRDGAALLHSYRVVMTGSHAEYWSENMLDGLREYISVGGRAMYMSGNGLYWVTGVDDEEQHTIEVRRFGSPGATWEALPGEWFLSTTGRLGGLWRFRGLAPQRTVGVGFTAQGMGQGRGYVRTPASHDPRSEWIFDGVDGSQIGACASLVNGYGAASYELDRADATQGTPPHALVIATATGFSAEYHVAVDGLGAVTASTDGDDPLLRSDLVFFEGPAGGAVFAVGSIGWSACLDSTAAGDASVSRVTLNVAERFLDPEPFDLPDVGLPGSE